MYCKKLLKKPLEAPCGGEIRPKTRAKPERALNENRRVWGPQELCEIFHNLPRQERNGYTHRGKTLSELRKRPLEEITSGLQSMPLDQRPKADLEIPHTLSL